MFQKVLENKILLKNQKCLLTKYTTKTRNKKEQMNPPGVIPVRKEHIQAISIAGWKAISYRKVLLYPIATLI